MESSSEQNSISEREKLFSKENFLSFLREELFRRKKSRASFNMTKLAGKSGVSKSLLSLILKGKRSVSLTTAEGLAKGLGLRGRKRRYFLTLSRLHNARTDEEKWNIQNELMRIREAGDESLLELRQYRVVSEVYYSALYVLCGLKNISHSTESLKTRLHQNLSLEQVQRALDDLIQLGLLKKEGERYLQTHKALTTGSDQKDAALYQYHRQMLELAKASLKFPSNQREIAGLTVAIPKDKLKTVKIKIRDFISDLNEYLSQFEEAEKVYQLNTQLFELTKEPKETEQ